MKQKAVQKMAEKDAREWLAAEMFYGEGAGVRRRHLEAEIASKVERINDYHQLFTKAYDALDKNKFAKAAIKERKSIDRAAKASKNFRALRRGNLAGLSNGLYVAGIAVIVAHQTGYDKKIEAEAKKVWANAKAKVKAYNSRGKVYNFYSNHGMERDA